MKFSPLARLRRLVAWVDRHWFPEWYWNARIPFLAKTMYQARLGALYLAPDLTTRLMFKAPEPEPAAGKTSALAPVSAAIGTLVVIDAAHAVVAGYGSVIEAVSAADGASGAGDILSLFDWPF